MEYDLRRKRKPMTFTEALKLLYKIEKTEFVLKEDAHNKHDKKYKEILSKKEYFIDFVKEFMKINLKEEITEDNITLMDKEFITIDFEEQESDLIYEVKQKDNNNIYFILLEIQSRVDRKMGYRLLNYMVEIWRKWEKNRDKGKKFILPKIIPCVLYNGERRWSAPVEFKGLYEEVGEEEDYLVNFKYMVIDLNRYNEEDLIKLGNVIGAVFYLDTASEENIEQRINQVGKLKVDKENKKDILRWLAKGLNVDKEIQEKLEKQYFEEEIEMSNLAMIGENWRNKVREEVREEVKQENVRYTVKRLLIKKLKNENKEVEKIIKKASIKKLEEVEDRIFEINSWEEVEEILL